jgi:hypothetical protein
MKIHNECTFLKPDGLAKVENMYKATFVMESCLKDKHGEWCNFPAAIFYTEEAHPQGSNYFALYFERMSITSDPRLLIMNGISATEPFEGIQIGDNVYYSRYRHDYRECGPVAIDGGRDYTKLVGDISVCKKVTLKVNKDKLEVVE